MSFFSKIAGLFSRSSKEESLLLQGLEHAKAKQPEKALEIYNALLTTPKLSASVRGSALYNRSSVYSAMKDDDRAVADLQEVITLAGVPDNILSAAKARLIRVKKRTE